ncbi:hypothetical protein BMS3Bbin02_02327 [bacterium BMS3Bbin02]|nr:hypothetical protein BMS3Bbin02_02327 [bacterium BMS3Bbin02]
MAVGLGVSVLTSRRESTCRERTIRFTLEPVNVVCPPPAPRFGLSPTPASTGGRVVVSATILDPVCRTLSLWRPSVHHRAQMDAKMGEAEALAAYDRGEESIDVGLFEGAVHHVDESPVA